MLLLNVCVQAGPSASPLKQLFGSRVSTLSEALGDGPCQLCSQRRGWKGPGWCLLYRELFLAPLRGRASCGTSRRRLPALCWPQCFQLYRRGSPAQSLTNSNISNKLMCSLNFSSVPGTHCTKQFTCPILLKKYIYILINLYLQKSFKSTADILSAFCLDSPKC